MDKFQNKYRIASNRWQYWDYSLPGSYYITICIAGKEELLGHIENGKMILSEYGEIVKSEFLRLPDYHQRVSLEEWVIMPNHVHCIIWLDDYCDGENEGEVVVEIIHELSLRAEDEIKQYRKHRRKMLIPKILGKFQMQTSKRMNILGNTPGKTNWQPNYYDHVIRGDDDYARIREYIIDNPSNWKDDKFNNFKDQ